ncbi:trypsin-like serine protease [Allokutzneria multivorans]|uniref:Trypsin-like serine protease n=1 Tax=Allokutzneria multivorans TaxID=1142134 RepID=A0ABP7SDQ5_9PSEU
MLAAALPAVADTPSARIVGGHPSPDRSYAVSIQLTYQGNPNFHLCGGTLISRDAVVTAGHCVEASIGAPPITALHVRIGSRDNTRGFSARVIAAASNAFDPVAMTNDIAVLKLDRHMPLLPALIGHTPTTPGTAVTATGWGRTTPDNTGPTSRMLMQATVSTLPAQACAAGQISAAEMCAQGVQGVGVCGGDSGSGLMQHIGTSRWEVLVGLSSRTGGSAEPPRCGQSPDIYTDVAAHKRWIYTTALALGAQAPRTTAEVPELPGR